MHAPVRLPSKCQYGMLAPVLLLPLGDQDPDNPYRYLAVHGRVVEITEDGADAHIDSLAKKYLGVDQYPYRRPGETRVIYKIQSEHASAMG